MKGYHAEIVYSMRPIDKRKRLTLVMDSDAIKISDVLDDGKLIIENIENAHVMEVHNEFSDNKDYTVYLFEADGGLYSTSSKSLWDSFEMIVENMGEEITAGENISIAVAGKASKNYKGNFLTCKLL